MGVLGSDIKILADEIPIKSKGNLEGFIDFMNQDISYLEKEIKELLNECKGEANYE